jgi:copper chaperone NosL
MKSLQKHKQIWQKQILVLIALFLIAAGCGGVSTTGPHVIETHKECPLCGMIPARYPLFNCQILFEDGTYEAFDSAAGLLIYLHFPDKTGFPLKKVRKIYFKDYLYEKWIDAETTWFVVGSEILGPMGIEFLPVSSEKMALELRKEEKGAAVVFFNNIDRAFMKKAGESGWLHFLARKLVIE